MKLKNILKQYNIKARSLETVVNCYATLNITHEHRQCKVEYRNEDLYMRHYYPETGKYGNWKCVAKVDQIKDELSKLPELQRS